MTVGRDYDKELEAAEAKVARIKAAKAAAERRRYEPVGRAMYEVFGDELNGLKGKVALSAFCHQLRDCWDAAQGAQKAPESVVSDRDGLGIGSGSENVSERLLEPRSDDE